MDKLFIRFWKCQDTHVVYIRTYLVPAYIERLFSIVCCFFRYIFWSANYISWISKFHNFFLTCSETEARFTFGVLQVLPFMEKLFQTFQYRFSFLHLVCKLFKGDFQPLFWSVKCISWVSEFFNIFLGDVQMLKH